MSSQIRKFLFFDEVREQKEINNNNNRNIKEEKNIIELKENNSEKLNKKILIFLP